LNFLYTKIDLDASSTLIILFYFPFEGILTADEQRILEEIHTSHNKYSLPIVWALSIVMKARAEGRIEDDFGLKLILEVRSSVAI